MKSFSRVHILLLFPILLLINSCSSPKQPFSFRQTLTHWQIISSDSLTVSPQIIASPGVETGAWIPARVPSTVLGALVESGKYKNVFVGENLETIDPRPFRKSWWYRTVFQLSDLKKYPYAVIRFNGLNYRANIWLNGRKIAAADSLYGAFRLFEFDISSLAKEKDNVIAVQVFPPQAGDFTVGFVDWNPAPSDKNIGLWRPVEILRSSGVRLKHPFVRSVLNKTMDDAKLTVQVTVQNLLQQKVTGILTGKIDRTTFKKSVRLLPGQVKLIAFNSSDFPQLELKHPRLWWPHTMGKPQLYSLDLRFILNNRISDQKKVVFGIRKVEDYFNKQGFRGYKINGRKILIMGAGWTDDLFLSDTPQNVRAQLRYVQHIGLNAVRLEGFWGNDQTLYNACDSLGILLMVGTSCQWEWDNYLGKSCDRFGGVKTPADIDLVTNYWRDQVLQLRNHPSIFVWLGGSDMLPRPALEKQLINLLKFFDGTRPYLAAAAGAVSEISGPTGVKMNGPYDYVPPKYWYEDTAHGGAFGFNTETGPGAQPPVLSSVQKMIPAQHLWPIDSVWNYHCGRGEFHTLGRYLQALEKRYGQPTDLKDFIQKAQAQNYEAMRPMFEAFAVNRFKATGVIQWMLNSAWPEMYWQLYDYYLMPDGAFYGAKKACALQQLIYNYKNHGIYLSNLSLQALPHVTAEIRVLDLQSNSILNKKIKTAIDGNAFKKIFDLSTLEIPSSVYFLDLRLRNARGNVLARNFYWLSKTEDELDYANSKWYVTPIKRFADFTALERLPQTTVQVDYKVQQTAPGRKRLTVTLKNKGKQLAFFIYLEVQKENGEPLAPIFWNDNFISLLPGEQRTLTADFTLSAKPSLKISGWNTTIRWMNK